MKKTTFVVFLLLFISSTFFTYSENVSSDIMTANIPIKYGADNFNRRILERTEGKRQPVGIVLSGGSARAFAHIGVLSYLEQQKIVPDFIISNSMGSIIGLLYASGLSPKQILSICASTPLEDLFDTTFPLNGGILDTTKFASLIKTIIGDISYLEKTPIPIMIIAEDLVTKRQIQIAEGKIIDVLNASYALPVYYSPVKYKKHLLVDGGITNLVPLDAAFEYSNQIIVSTTFYDAKNINLKNSISILNTSIDIGKRREGIKTILNHDDAIWIRCDVEDVSFMAFDKIDYLYEKGYESAERQSKLLKPLSNISDNNFLLTERESLQPILDKTVKEYATFEHLTLERPQNILALGINSYDKDFGYNLFRDTTLTMNYSFAYKDYELFLGAGGSSPLYKQDVINLNGFANVGFECFPIYNLRLKIEGFGFINSINYDFLANERLDYRLSWIDSRLSITLLQLAEFEYSKRILLLTEGINSYYKSFNNQLELQANARYLCNINFLQKNIRHFVDNRIKMTLQRDFFSFAISEFSRFDIDKNNMVPIYPGDSIKSTNPNLFDAKNNQYLAATSVKIGFIPQKFKPTFGEFLMFKDSGISIFADLLWTKSTFIPYLTTGVQLQTNTSLMGLKDLPISAFLGYEYDYDDDNTYKGFLWGLKIGSFF